MAAVSSETDIERGFDFRINFFVSYFCSGFNSRIWSLLFPGISAYDVSDGTLRFSDDLALWGTASDSQLLFDNTTDVVLTGKGTIDGQGLKWWRVTAPSSLDSEPLATQKFHI